MTKVLTETEIYDLLKEGDFDMPEIDESTIEFRSKQLEEELNKIMIRFLHPDAPIKEIKTISYEIFKMFSKSWDKAKREQETKKKIQQCFKER